MINSFQESNRNKSPWVKWFSLLTPFIFNKVYGENSNFYWKVVNRSQNAEDLIRYFLLRTSP